MDRQQRLDFIAGNRKEYGGLYDSLCWPTAGSSRAAEARRDELLARLAGRAQSAGKASKLYTRGLSPGCRACGAGSWSCLFVNGICNGRCFYCPTPQKEKGEPTTNTLTFPTPQDYTDYLERLEIKGASLSGGEPLLTFDRTLSFVREIKKKLGDGIYLWLYTNGILATGEKLSKLAAAGLDEIRVDLTATGYDLTPVRLARASISTVTVEIPAIPEDEERLEEILLALSDLGVSYLNLHQLRATPHNAGKLLGRGYTFLHGPKVTVLESELMALRALGFALEKDLSLAVNYCSYIYKNRYQTAGARKRSASLIYKPHETVTETGLIRTLSVKGEPAELARAVEILAASDTDRDLWELNPARDRLYFHPALAGRIDSAVLPPLISYHLAAIKPAVSYRHPFKEIRLPHRKKIVVERQPVAVDLRLHPEDAKVFLSGLQSSQARGQKEIQASASGQPPGLAPAAFPGAAGLKGILPFEALDAGLFPYF